MDHVPHPNKKKYAVEHAVTFWRFYYKKKKGFDELNALKKSFKDRKNVLSIHQVEPSAT